MPKAIIYLLKGDYNLSLRGVKFHYALRRGDTGGAAEDQRTLGCSQLCRICR